MKIRLLFTLAFLTVLFELNAKETKLPKIGYTNLDYVLSFLPEAKKIESDYRSFEKQLKKKLEFDLASFQEKLEAFQKRYATMTDAVRSQKQTELQALQSNIEKLQLESQESLANKQIELLQPAYDKIQKAIEEVAKEEGYTHILSSDAGGIPILLYAEEDNNISEIVLEKLGITPPIKQEKKK